MSFNIDSKLMAHQEFIPWFVEELEKRNLSPRQVKLEILERSLISESSGEWIKTCQQHGFLIALDDFGTGYASFAYINRFNFDVLKLDRSFVKEITHDRASLDICRSIVILAQLLGMEVVAEGIESMTKGDMLRGMGCTYGQGYYYSKPLNFESLIEYIKNNEAR